MTPLDIPPPDALRERIRTAVAGTATVGLSLRSRIIASLVVVAAAVSLGIAVLRPDLGVVPLGALVAVTASVALLAVATLVVALSPGSRGLGAPIATVVAVAALTGPLYAAITVAAAVGAASDGSLVRGCFSLSMAVATIALSGLTFALRGSVPVAPVARGALLGACAGAWAGVTVHLHCPCGDRLHILVGHAVPIIIFSVLGAIVSPRVLRP